MPIFKPIQESEAKGKVKEIYDEIKKTRQITEVPNFWKMLANDPNELDRTWSSLKDIMKKGALDPVTKEQAIDDQNNKMFKEVREECPWQTFMATVCKREKMAPHERIVQTMEDNKTKF